MNNSILAILSVLTLSSLIGIESLCAQDHVTVKVFPAGCFCNRMDAQRKYGKRYPLVQLSDGRWCSWTD
jgi:hypothetical protein